MMKQSAMITVLACAASCTAQPSLTDGLLAHWTFDMTFADASGNGYDGQPNGGIGFVPGVYGEAAEFDGIDDWILVESQGDLSFDIDSESYSIAFWINVSGDGSQIVMQDRHPDPNLPVSYFVFIDTLNEQVFRNGMWWGHNGPGSWFTDIGSGEVLGGWRHIAIVQDAVEQTVRIYVDGALRGFGVRPHPGDFPGGDSQASTIGAGLYPQGLQSFLNGQLDDLRIYDRPLSELEVGQLAGTSCYADCNGDGRLDIFDYLCFQDLFNIGCGALP